MIRSNKIVSPVSLIEMSLSGMDMGGFNPKNRNNSKMIIAYFLGFYVTLMFILQNVYQFTKNPKDNGNFIVDVLLITGYWQLAMKISTLLTKHRPLLKLINMVETKFWSLDEVKESKREEIQLVYNTAKLSVNCYFSCITATIIGHYITSYFRGNGNLITNIWMPEILARWNETIIGHHFIFIIQGILMLYMIYPAMVEIDSMYIILLAAVLGQFKILKLKLISVGSNFTIEENLNLLVKCIGHHNLLLEYLKEIEDIYSMELFHTAGTIIGIAVLAIYSAFKEDNISQIVTYAFMVIVVFAQLFIYCFLGQVIQDETESVADAAYQCKWEDIPDKRLQDTLILIIVRSQQKVNIKMGGLFTLTLETFTRVAKTMLSLLTFLTKLSGTEE